MKYRGSDKVLETNIKKIGTTGGSPSNWDHFNEIQAFFAPFKSYRSDSLVVDNINTSPPSSPIPATSSPSPPITAA
ncbi:hypothetical protein DOY81_013312 [Sarcophaga bullata]|nr:hypothetical protein DOY81_013312 [Sarcophaga bullata]